MILKQCTDKNIRVKMSKTYYYNNRKVKVIAASDYDKSDKDNWKLTYRLFDVKTGHELPDKVYACNLYVKE